MIKRQPFFSYFLCGLLYFMWQTSNTLAANSHPWFGYEIDPSFSTMIFMLHYLVGALALVLVGVLCDKYFTSSHVRRRLAIALTALACLFTVLRITASHVFGYYTLYLLATLLGFGANAILLGGIFRKVSYSTRPLCFGLAFAASVLIRLPIDLYDQGGGPLAHTAYILFGSAALFVLAVLLWATPVKEALELPETAEPKPVHRPRLLFMAIVCSLAVYILFGIFDELVTGTPVMKNTVLLIRLTQIVFSILAGMICYRSGYYAAVLSSVSLLGIGTLAHFLTYDGLGGVLFASTSVAGLQFFMGPVRSLFADLGNRGKYPYTVTSLGFAAYFLFQIIGVPFANLIRLLGEKNGTVLYLLLFMIAIPLIILFFNMLRTNFTTNTQASLPQHEEKQDAAKGLDSFALTRREKEILKLVLQGSLSREIAEALFVSESTVNWHVGNILKKAGVESRARLIEQYGDKG